MDLKGQGYIDLKEFVHGFFKIYFSNLDTKLKLIFDMYVKAFHYYTLFCRYDFDKDGFIIKDDVKMILSHVPITNTVTGHVAEEGAFTQEGGGSQVFLDRI